MKSKKETVSAIPETAMKRHIELAEKDKELGCKRLNLMRTSQDTCASHMQEKNHPNTERTLRN